jgi:hypothetical protein
MASVGFRSGRAFVIVEGQDARYRGGAIPGATAMGPMVFICGGCRARIRTSRPDVARTRACPRCQMPLANAIPLDAAWPSRSPALGLAEDGTEATDDGLPSRRRSIRRALGPSLALAALLTPILYRAIPDPGRSPLFRVTPASSVRVTRIPPVPDPQDALRPPADDPDGVPPVAVSATTPEVPSPARPTSGEEAPSARPSAAAASPSIPEPSGDGEEGRSPPAIPALPSSEPRVPDGPRRVVVIDQAGRRQVCRLYAQRDGQAVVTLPDGSLGLPSGLIDTDEPFRAATIDEVRGALQEGPYRGFDVVQERHYLVFSQGSREFAEASARLLESLYQGLSKALRDKGVEVQEAEFPLVAVIYATEADFRSHRPVDPDVQAYYDVYSNQIVFYETSRRDQDAPEISARRRPQTVAHEGTHQILQNIGVHPRLAPWPAWLVEGLAEYCAPTTTGRHGTWARFGAVNPFHMATLLDLHDSLALPQTPPGPTSPRIGPPMVEGIVGREELRPTDYAVAWALTHYLATRRFEDFLEYLKRMGRLEPLETRTAEQHLAEFRDGFGAELARMDRKIGLHLAGLKGYEAIPYYAVVFEQPLGPGLLRRATLVSRSPSVIRQWLDTIPSPQGGPIWWRATSWPTRTRALLETEAWGRGR